MLISTSLIFAMAMAPHVSKPYPNAPLYVGDILDSAAQQGCALNSASMSGSLGQVIPGASGNIGLDRGLTEDHTELLKLTSLAAQVFLLREAEGSNAFATPSIDRENIAARGGNADYWQDGTVYLGINLINKLYSKNQDFAVPSVLAHEFGHISQFKRGLRYQMTKWTELQADYIAGWFTAHRSRFRNQNLLASWTAFFELGDSNFASPNHHGTSQERSQAFAAGVNLNLQNGVSDYWVAYDAGKKYVESLGAR